MPASKIIPKKSVVSKVPESTALVPGEIAINYADKIIYGRHPSKNDTDPDAVVALGAPYIHSHDELYSLDKTKQLELTDDGDITISDGSIVTTITPTSTESRAISLPDKNGTLATTDDITASVGDANSLVSPDASKTLTLTDNGTLDYVAGTAAARVYVLPGSAGTIGLRGGDTIISETKPESAYAGLRWIDSASGRAFDWFIDASGGGHWVEMGVGSDGRQVDFRVSGGYIQWQYAGDAGWVNLVALTDLKGDPGLDAEAVNLRVDANNYIQWRLGGGAWTNLVSLLDLKGPPGSNATVTTASINSALGYTPDNPILPRTPSAHTHDDRYYTETEVNTLLAGKQAVGSYATATHNHDASQITTGKLSIDRIPVLPSQAPVVSSGTLAALTASQISEIATGTVVITTDGKRYVYKGTGDKTAIGSYIELADLTPTWASVTDKPSWIATFNPDTSQFSYTQITGLATVANTADYNHLINQPAIPAAQVNADWAATEGVQAIYNKPVLFSGSYNDLTDLPALAGAKIRRSAWDAVNKYSYLGSAAASTDEGVAGWTITRIATTPSGSASVLTQTGAWTNRANLFP